MTLDISRPTFLKDPNATLDYVLDLSAWLKLGADTLATASAAGTGVSVVSCDVVGKTVLVWVSGGTVGQPGSVRIRFTTTKNRVDDRTLFFKIKER